MTDAKPLSAEELRWFNTRHLFDSDSSIARLLATIRGDRELIRWLASRPLHRKWLELLIEDESCSEFAKRNARDVLAIVEAGDE